MEDYMDKVRWGLRYLTARSRGEQGNFLNELGAEEFKSRLDDIKKDVDLYFENIDKQDWRYL
jgi:hypothetical protein